MKSLSVFNLNNVINAFWKNITIKMAKNKYSMNIHVSNINYIFNDNKFFEIKFRTHEVLMRDYERNIKTKWKN